MLRSYAKVISAMLIWGSISIFVRSIPYRSSEIVMCRVILGLLFLLIIWKLSKRRLDRAALKRNLARLMVSGVIMGFNWVALFESYSFVDVSIATLGYYCAPVFVVIGSYLLFRERLGLVRLIGVIGAVLGMFIVTGVVMGGPDPYKGLALALISAALYAGVTLLNKTVSGLGGLEITIFQLIGAGLVITPYALLTHTGPWAAPSLTAAASILTMGFVHTGIALYLYFSAIQELPAQSVALCSYLDPVSALVFAAVFFSERLSGIQILGAVIIIGGAAAGEIFGRRNAAGNEAALSKNASNH